MRSKLIAGLFGALLLAGACASTPERPIPLPVANCTHQVQSRLYFGLDTPDGPVTDTAWEAFVDGVVTPRFAQGLTIFEARGQWRDAKGATAKEGSRVIELVHADSAEQRQALNEIVSTYKARFRQEAVLLTQTPVRACF